MTDPAALQQQLHDLNEAWRADRQQITARLQHAERWERLLALAAERGISADQLTPEKLIAYLPRYTVTLDGDQLVYNLHQADKERAT